MENKGTPRFTQDSEKIQKEVKVIEPGSVAVMMFKNLSNDILDLWLGASAGALNAYVIKIIKSKIKSTVGLDKTPAPESKD